VDLFAMKLLFYTALASSLASPGAAARSKPHVLFLLADDLGHYNVGWHNRNTSECATPTLNGLAQDGIVLERHYAYKFCSPSRSSMHSGRLPVHVNDQNKDPEVYNRLDPESGYQGIPVNMTGLATQMRRGGYRTHMTGKWDAGMARHEHTPCGRGFETWLGYFHHANDYYKEGLPPAADGTLNVCFNRFTDLWDTDGPAARQHASGLYEEDLFTNRTVAVIEAHDAANTSAPLFLVHAFHLVHTPLQVPAAALARFPRIGNSQRQHVAAMAAYLDDQVAIIVAALKANANMWDDSACAAASRLPACPAASRLPRRRRRSRSGRSWLTPRPCPPRVGCLLLPQRL
jgi:arylsulfatase B